MKWRPRLKIYATSSKKVTFDPETFEAHSYEWWCFVKKINGKVIFNNYDYSMTTNKHQYDVQTLFRELNIKIDQFVYIRGSLTKSTFIHDSLQYFYKELFETELQLNKKGARKNKREERLCRIEELNKEIKNLKKLGAEFSIENQNRLKERIEGNETRRLEEQREKRIKNKALTVETKEKVNELGPIDFTTINNQMNNLASI